MLYRILRPTWLESATDQYANQVDWSTWYTEMTRQMWTLRCFTPASIDAHWVELSFYHFTVMAGRRYFAECGLQNTESRQGVICGKSSEERSANYPLSAFPHSAAEKFSIFADRKTVFARIVQQMCNRCIAECGIPGSFPSILFVVHLPKNMLVTILTNFKASYFRIPSVMSFR